MCVSFCVIYEVSIRGRPDDTGGGAMGLGFFLKKKRIVQQKAVKKIVRSANCKE